MVITEACQNGPNAKNSLLAAFLDDIAAPPEGDESSSDTVEMDSHL